MEQNKTKVAYTIFSTTRNVLEEVKGVMGDFKFFFVGVALAVGGVLLLLGGITAGLILLFIVAGYNLIVSFLMGFLAVGVIGLASGILFAKHAFDKLKTVYKKHEAKHVATNQNTESEHQTVREVIEAEEEEGVQNLRILD